MVNITIDNKEIKVNKDYTVLKVCRDMGINIPTLCHDDRLKSQSACRLCVVEIEGMRTLQTSCSTEVRDGMKIKTNSKKVREARREILRLILSDHPQECLTCEKAGSCKLQQYCEEINVGKVVYEGERNKYPIDNSNPFYYRDMTKCINCGKCIRVCNELQCTNALTFIDRGFKSHVGAEFDKDIDNTVCVSCGNCVSVCPVGALMPKNNNGFRLSQAERVRTTCSYCGVGCQMDLMVKDNKVLGVEPADGPSNNGLLCVKGKFGYKFINHPDRLKKPLIKKEGKFVESSWEEAYELISKKAKEVKENKGADAFAGLTSARCSNEENYLFQKLFRAVIGTNNVDHCARL